MEALAFIAVIGGIFALSFLPFALGDLIGALASRSGKAVADFGRVGQVIDNTPKIQSMITDQF
jgi:hypothetical protein